MIQLNTPINYTQKAALTCIQKGGGQIPMLRIPNFSRVDCTYLVQNRLIEIPAINKGRWVKITKKGLDLLQEEADRESASIGAVLPTFSFEGDGARPHVETNYPSSEHGWNSAVPVETRPRLIPEISRQEEKIVMMGEIYSSGHKLREQLLPHLKATATDPPVVLARKQEDTWGLAALRDLVKRQDTQTVVPTHVIQDLRSTPGVAGSSEPLSTFEDSRQPQPSVEELYQAKVPPSGIVAVPASQIRDPFSPESPLPTATGSIPGNLPFPDTAAEIERADARTVGRFFDAGKSATLDDIGRPERVRPHPSSFFDPKSKL